MEASAYIDEIRLKLTSNMLELELDDATLTKILNASLRELQRYYCSVKLITVPFNRCIDMTEYKVNSVSAVYRTDGMVVASDGNATADPMAVSQWQLLTGTGNLRHFQDYVYNYASWNTLQQLRNTTSTDLAFRYDKASEKLYINTSTSQPNQITIEYVPRLDNVNEITSDFWIDTLVNLAVAQTKIAVGRVRSRFTQNGALWQQDGASILQEGLQEYKDLQQYMRQQTQLFYPID